MSEEPQFIEEIAPLTQEQWDRVIEWGRLNKAVAEWHETALNPNAQRAVKASLDFQKSMQQIETNTGIASEQLPGLQSAFLDMAK